MRDRDHPYFIFSEFVDDPIGEAVGDIETGIFPDDLPSVWKLLNAVKAIGNLVRELVP